MNNLIEINGKQVLIENLALHTHHDTTVAEIQLTCNKKTMLLRCQEVSLFYLEQFTLPMQIAGIEILDNKQLGWESSQRFRIHDLEDSSISFFCSSYTLECIS